MAIITVLTLVILAAGGYVYHWYRISRQGPEASAVVPSIKWSKNFGLEQQFVTSPILAADGSLYLASVRGALYSLDSSGALQWEYHQDEFIAGGLLQDPDKNIYFTTLSKVFSLDSSGRKRWEATCTQQRTWQDEQGTTFDGNLLYAQCGKSFVALNRNDGTQLWSRPPLDMEATPVVMSDGTLVVVSGGRMTVLDRDGNTLWAYPGDSPATQQNAVDIGSPVAIGVNENFYAGSRLGDRFLGFDSHGNVQWSLALHDQPFRSSPVIAGDGTIYAITMRDVLFAISLDGTEKWRFQLPKLIHIENHASPVLGRDGTIYVLAEERVLAVSPEGKLVWEMPLPGSVGGTPALAPDGTLYVPTIEGIVYAIQTASHGLMQSPWPRYQHDLSNSGRELGVGK